MPRGERTADGVFPAGALIAGKYRIERMVGQGGMGTVYAAQHETLRQRVALKVLRDQAMVEATTVERFLNEARAASRIQNEHVARVMDAGQTDDGLPYIVLEFLEVAERWVPASELVYHLAYASARNDHGGDWNQYLLLRWWLWGALLIGRSLARDRAVSRRRAGAPDGLLHLHERAK